MNQINAARTVLVVCAFALCAFAAPGAPLSLGDKAPALQLSKWLKGDPVTSLNDSKHVYVVEFWATWCAPCQESIPHLTELQKKYKDKGLIIIGISTEEEAPVQKFLKDMGDKMGYCVALDLNDKTWDAYATPFGVEGFPHAFVISRTGDLLWQGHPMDDMDTIIEQALAGTLDVAKAKQVATDKALQEEQQEIQDLRAQEYIVLARYGRDTAGADKIGNELLNLPAPSLQSLGLVAWNILTNESMKYRNMPFALKASEKLNALSKGNNPLVLDTYALALFENGKKDEAIKQGELALKNCTDNDMKDQIKEHLDKFKGNAVIPQK